MTLQTLFDTVATHLITQNARSILLSGGERCAYFGPAGLQCAVGCLMDPAKYSSDLEGQSIEYAEVRDALRDDVAALVRHDAHARFLLRDLQDLHDHVSPENWREQLESIADDYRLTTPVERTA